MKTLPRLALTGLFITAAALAAIGLGASPAAGSQGSLSFRATISGRVHDAGTISAAEHASTIFDATGCAVIKKQDKAIYGAYEYEIRDLEGATTALIPGQKPQGPSLLLTVDHYRNGSSSGTYRVLDVSGTFALHGRSYGGGASSTSIVKIKNGGRDGTWTEPQGHRDYPSAHGATVAGFSFRATWHCATVFHLTEPKLFADS
jgi:hypothetical protein